MQINSSLLTKSVSVPGKLFVFWRALFGVYFVYYAIHMFPYLQEVYGREGLVSNIAYNWTFGLFPNIVLLLDNYNFIIGIHVVLIITALTLAVGFFPRVSAFIIWYLQTSLFNTNNLTDDPSMAFVGLLLLALALVPEQKTMYRKGQEIRIPFFVFYVPVFVFCVTFTISALDKIASFSWLHGTAFMQMLHLGIARDNLLVSGLIAHPSFAEGLSYIAILTQLVCLPLFLLGKYRWALMINFLSFSFMFLLFDLNQVIYGMLFFYSFFLLPNFEKFQKNISLICKYCFK